MSRRLVRALWDKGAALGSLGAGASAGRATSAAISGSTSQFGLCANASRATAAPRLLSTLAGRPVTLAGVRYAAPAGWSARRTYTESVVGVHGDIKLDPFLDEQVAVMKNPAQDFCSNAVVDMEITKFHLKEQCQGKWAVLLFYPKDFTFVCPTELIAFSDRHREFDAINAKVIGVSTDTEEVHLAWCRTPRKKGGLGKMQIPLVADPTHAISKSYGTLAEDLGIAYRGLYIINPEGVVVHYSLTDFPVGRSVDETLRLIQAYQFVAEHGEVCPADWQPGDKTMKADADASLEYFESANEGEGHEVASKVPALKNEEEFRSAIAKGPTVVDFYAPWCGKCQQIGPFVEKLMDKYSNVKFVKVDTENPAMSGVVSQLGVKALPAFRFFKDGKEVAPEVSGYKKQRLEEAVGKL